MKIPVKTAKDTEHETEELQQEQEGQETDASPPEGEEENVAAQESEDTDQIGEEHVSPETESDETPKEEEAEAEQACSEEEDELTRLQKALAAKEQEVKEHYEARLRLQAEFDNFKKRKEKETLEFRKYANEDFIRELLVVADDFDRAIVAAEQSHKLEDFLKGIELIFDKFLSMLQKKGVKEIDAAPGQPFNPEFHEAMTQVETDEVEEGAVAAVFQKGYYLHDRVLLAAKVAVAKHSES